MNLGTETDSRPVFSSFLDETANDSGENLSRSRQRKTTRAIEKWKADARIYYDRSVVPFSLL